MSQAREPPILRQRNNHLPDDIVLNILARLPIKSFLRFRCVCKPRNSSITSPNFFSTHLNIINNNNGYLIHMPHLQDNIVQLAMVTCDRTFTRISKLEIPLNSSVFFCPNGRSFNGLLCLFNRVFHNVSVNLIYLWNSSIRKLKKLPDSCLSKLENFIRGSEENGDSNLG